MDLLANQLTLPEAREFLRLNGVDWSLQWIRTQVWMGKISSRKVFSSRVIDKAVLEVIIRQKRGLQ